MARTKKLGRRIIGALMCSVLVTLIVWACSAPHPQDGLSAAAAEASEIPRGTSQSAPGPSGEILQLDGPTGIVQTCAFDASAVLLGGSPAVQVSSATLTAQAIDATVFFSAPATELDPLVGTALWSVGRSETASWPAGVFTLIATAQLTDGTVLEAALGSYVGEAVFGVNVADQDYFDGDTLVYSCVNPTPGTPGSPVPQFYGTPVPGGPLVPCGPVLSGGQVLPPNENEEGEPVLELSPALGTTFSLTVLNPGAAQVQFNATQYRTAVVTMTVMKPIPQAPNKKMDVYLEGIIFDHVWPAEIDDGGPMRRNGLSGKNSAYPDDFITPAWTEENEDLGAKKYDPWPKSIVDLKADEKTPLARGERANDSFALYKRTGRNDRRTIRALFRIEFTDDSFGPNGVNKNAKYFPAEIGTGSIKPANQAFFARYNPDADEPPAVRQLVWFETTPEGLENHKNHQHSVSDAVLAPGNANGNTNPTLTAQPGGPVLPIVQPSPQNPHRDKKGNLIRGPHKPGRKSRDAHHLHQHYVYFDLPINSARLDSLRWWDETLQWRFFDWYQKKWRDVIFKPAGNPEPKGQTNHRLYVLGRNPGAPWAWELSNRKGQSFGNAARPRDEGSDLSDVHLVWNQLLDEVLKPAGQGGAVGGLTANVELNEKTIAAAMTRYLWSHDNPGVVKRGCKVVYDANSPLEAGRMLVFKGGFNTQAMRQNGRRQMGVDMQRMFYGFLNKNPRTGSKGARLEISCFELSSVNSVLTNLVGVDMKVRIEAASGKFNPISAALAVWGSADANGGETKVIDDFEHSYANPTNHTFNTLDLRGETWVYDVLYGKPAPVDAPILDANFLDYHLTELKWKALIHIYNEALKDHEKLPKEKAEKLARFAVLDFIDKQTLNDSWQLEFRRSNR